MTSVAFSPDNQKILSGSGDKTLRLWDVSSGKLLKSFLGHTKWVYSVAFSPDGLQIVSGSEDQSAKLWDDESGLCSELFMIIPMVLSQLRFLLMV